jgi:hypothetical protein
MRKRRPGGSRLIAQQAYRVATVLRHLEASRF